MANHCLLGIIVFQLTLMGRCAPALPSSEVTPLLPTSSAAVLPVEEEIEILVYFTSSARYEQGIQPFESAVIRRVPADSYLPYRVLEEFFRGPTKNEQELGLEAITSGFTALRSMEISHGYAHVYLDGACQSNGATYTVAQSLLRNLAQFPDILYVKIYDEHGTTGDPEGTGHSIPFCLEP